MALRFSLTGGGPLAALFSSPFKINNTEFPSDGSGTSISFTAKRNAGSVATTGGGGVTISFSSGGTTKLYLPQNLTTQYTANYQETEVSKIVANLLDTGVSGDSWDAVKAAATNNVKGMIEEGTGLSGARAAYDYRNNQVYNNHMEVMFTGMGFRQFQFDFKFFPRSQAESDQIDGLIRGFKFHMHPELKPDTAGAYFIPPSTYEIAITGPGAQYYNAYKESALIDLSVNYTGGGVAAQFKSGAPTEIDLSLTFKELEYNTKDDVSAGI